MIICADTSFLFSLYGADVNTSAAQAFTEAQRTALHVHVVNSFEFENAVRLRFFQEKFSEVDRDRIIKGYQADLESGRVILLRLNLPIVFEESVNISRRYTETLGNRAYDILQVAAAKLLGATDFWSFDGKQRELAKAEGLQVGP